MEDSDADDTTDNKGNKNEPPSTMAKAKKSKASATAASKKKAGTKTTGEDIINLESPPPKKKKKGAAKKVAEYFSTTTLKGFMVNSYCRGSKNRFDVVFQDSGVPSKAEEPVITLDHGGKALRVEWKLPEKLFTDLQATAQGINKDSAQFNGYGHTQDRMQQAGVHPVERFYRSVPQVLTLDQECTGNPRSSSVGTCRWTGLSSARAACIDSSIRCTS